MRGGRCSFKKIGTGRCSPKIQNSKFEIAGAGLPACGVRKKAPAFRTLYTNIQFGVKFVHVTHAWRPWPMRMAMGLVRMALKKYHGWPGHCCCGTLLFGHARTRGTKQHCSVSRESNIVVLFLFVTMHLDSG